MSKDKLINSRVKDWDSYLAVGGEGDYALSFTVADYGFYGLVECAVYDFVTKEKHVCLEKPKLTMSKLGLSDDLKNADFKYKSKYCNYHIDRNEKGSHFYCKYDRCFIHTELEADIRFKRNEGSVAFGDDFAEKNVSCFCRNMKILCMPVSGYVKVKGKTYIFDSSKDLGVFEFYRGTFPYKYTRLGGVGSGFVNGKPVGIALYNYYDDNELKGAFCYDGKCNEICDVELSTYADNVMNDWNLNTQNKSFNGVFKPFFNDRVDENNLVFSQHGDRLFGKFNGKAVLDGGRELNIKKMVAFMQRVNYKW